MFYIASSPVRQLSLSPVNYTHVSLTWRRPGDRNNYVTSYNVTLKQTATNTIREFIVQSRSLTIGNLTGNTPYTIDVFSMSVFGNDTLLSNASSANFITPTGREFCAVFLHIITCNILHSFQLS